MKNVTFAFDEQFTMFDVTPVENQFILEQLPGAKGDYVKVYLYGLMHCYHPREDMTTETMSRELKIPAEEILQAFRYWERHGAVRRISDHPPEWQYVNFRQQIAKPDTFEVDSGYAAFSQEIENAFEGIRTFRGNEIAEIYEWKEGSMQLPTEVILMILRHMWRMRGKNFRIADAEKLAVKLAEESARTEDEAAEMLSRDEAATAGMRRILRIMGKRYTPSEANMKLYMRWTREWGFTQEAIEEACGHMETSDPSLALLDAILQKTRENRNSAGILKKEDVRKSAAQHGDIRKVMRELGRTGAVTPYQESLYNKMLQLYPHEIIMMGARECGRKNKDPESLLQLLTSWKERGFATAEEVEHHISTFRDKEVFLKQIRSKWGSRETDAGGRHMDLLNRWEETLGMSRELILQAAGYAADARRPMAYMDSLMTRYAEKGIRTSEAAEQDHREHMGRYPGSGQKPGMKQQPAASDYSQRDYSDEQRAAMERMMNWNGGEDDA